MQTREEWLTLAANEIKSRIIGPSLRVPFRVSVGWPSSRATRRNGRAVGQCFDGSLSIDGSSEIFISPYLDDPIEVLATLTHELLHAVVGVKVGHGVEFQEACTRVGLFGNLQLKEPATETKPEPYLAEELLEIARELGDYPHARLDVTAKEVAGTRLLKCICINKDCPFKHAYGKPYTVRITWTVASNGTPFCGVCQERMGVIKPSKKGSNGGSGGGGQPEEEEEEDVIVIDPNAPSEPSDSGDDSESDSGDDEGDPSNGGEGGESGEGETSQSEAERLNEEAAKAESEETDDSSNADSDDSTVDSNDSGTSEISESEEEAEGESKEGKLEGINEDTSGAGGGDIKLVGNRGSKLAENTHKVSLTCDCRDCTEARKAAGL